MRLFRKKQRDSLISRALPILYRWIIPMGSRFQRWAEPRLSRIERQLSRRQKIIAITIFCVVATGYSTAVLVQALSGPPPRSPNYLAPSTITRPMSLPHRDSLVQKRKSTSHDSSFHPSSLNK